MWEEIAEAARPHFLTPQWVKGHSMDLDNFRVDKLARKAAKDQVAVPKTSAPHL
ncbi:MAG: RNase H family protein [Clostridia bacterium]